MPTQNLLRLLLLLILILRIMLATVYYRFGSWRLVLKLNFFAVTLTCEDDNSKLVDVVTVAADDDDHIGNSLLHICCIF